MPATSAVVPNRRVVWLLALVGLVGFALRTNISIAQEYMAPELGLSMTQMGVISAWGFQLAYTLFQVPGGFLGDRFGARVVLGVAVLGWALASLASAGVAGTGATAFAALFAARVLLGASQAATFPVSAMAAVQYVPAEARTGASAIYLAASALGAAVAPLTLAPLMARAGWRAVFVASAGVGFLAAALWFALAPRGVPAGQGSAGRPLREQLREAGRLLRHPPLLLLSGSYLLHSAVFFVFVFWFFRYLIEGRGISLLQGGFWGSVPYLLGTVAAPLAGRYVDRLARRIPAARARRQVAMTLQVVAAALVALGAALDLAPLAILALSASVACLLSCEAPFWTSATALAGDSAGAAGGVLNLMGNLGGVVSIWLVPVMKDAWGWVAMLLFWAGCAVVAAGLFALTGRGEGAAARG